jgi:hypothetical protein
MGDFDDILGKDPIEEDPIEEEHGKDYQGKEYQGQPINPPTKPSFKKIWEAYEKSKDRWKAEGTKQYKHKYNEIIEEAEERFKEEVEEVESKHFEVVGECDGQGC